MGISRQSGYIRNENKVDERKDIWHASFAATWEVVKNLKLAADIGIERNPDGDAKERSCFSYRWNHLLRKRKF